jgi:hypothetical protein
MKAANSLSPRLSKSTDEAQTREARGIVGKGSLALAGAAGLLSDSRPRKWEVAERNMPFWATAL